MGDTRLIQAARRRHRGALRAVVDELRGLREDAGLSQAVVARAATISPSYLSEIEAGRTSPTLQTLHALAAVLGCDLSIRLFPNAGPAIRDRFQARIIEALLRTLGTRWSARIEVPVQRPVRGVIDVVLTDRTSGLLVATEVHSDLRRVEQQLRWATLKADALALQATGVRTAAPPVSRLLILRSTERTRALATELAATFAAAYPADPGAALRALTSGDVPWPGPALLSATVRGTDVRLFARSPHAPLVP